MPVPQRPFRAKELPDEAQFTPAYRLLDRQVASDNIAVAGVMPFVTAASTGGSAATAQANIAWTIGTLTASTGGAGSVAVTLTHGLGRTPIGAFFVLPADSRTNVALFVTDVSNWNSVTMGLGVNFAAAGTATRSVVVF